LLLRPLGDTLYLLPPYCVDAELLQDCYDRIERCLR
jgi:adenosylmethionine-8-amino-7-oxononanoate aminotransferase